MLTDREKDFIKEYIELCKKHMIYVGGDGRKTVPFLILAQDENELKDHFKHLATV